MKTLLKPTGIIIHHSLTKDGQVADYDAIKRFHMTDPAYMMEDIGYHAVIERINGVVTVITGRPINREGGHTKGQNKCLGLCIVGNFDLAPPDQDLLRSAASLVRAWLMCYPHLGVADVHRHSEYAIKSCPGTQFPWTVFKQMLQVA